MLPVRTRGSQVLYGNDHANHVDGGIAVELVARHGAFQSLGTFHGHARERRAELYHRAGGIGIDFATRGDVFEANRIFHRLNTIAKELVFHKVLLKLRLLRVALARAYHVDFFLLGDVCQYVIFVNAGSRAHGTLHREGGLGFRRKVDD